MFTRIAAAANPNGVLHITFPQGRADGVAVRELYEASIDAIDGHDARLLVDFTGVDTLNSGMLGMLVTVRKKTLQSGAQLHVVLPQPMLMRQLVLTNLHHIIAAFADREHALDAFKA